MVIKTVTLPSLNPQATRKQRQARDAFKKGYALQQEQEWQQAINCYNISIRADMSDAFPALANRGMCYYQLSLPGLALADYDHALAIGTPEQRKLIRPNRGVLLHSVRRYDEALADLSVDDSDECLVNRAYIHLIRGDFRKGIELYHNRATSKQWKNSARKLSDITGKDVLVIHEQGYGDSIQMFRYIPRLQAVAKSLTWITRTPALVPLLEFSFPGVKVIVCNEIRAAALAYDMPHVLVMDLWELCDLEINGKPYLKAKNPEPWTTPRIGLAWRGRATYANDHNRSTTLETFRKYLPAGDYLSLQQDCTIEESEQVSHIEFNDFLRLAGLIHGLHGVIAVDTAAAHLAGAMGVRTALLLPFACDWRWREQGSITPWYDSVRLFRQPSFGNWEPAIRAASTWLSLKAQ